MLCFLFGTCMMFQNNWFILQLSDPPKTVQLSSTPDSPTILAYGATIVNLHCIIKEYNGNCYINWATGSITATQPHFGQNDQPAVLWSSVNITVERNNIGMNVTCTVSCDLIDTNIFATYTVIADCKFCYDLILYLMQNFIEVNFRQTYVVEALLRYC